MKTISPKKKDSNVIVITIDQVKVRRGHMRWPSRNEAFKDKRRVSRNNFRVEVE